MRCERHGTSVTDVGAQYITPTGDNSDLCDELRRAGLLVPLSGRIDGSRAADGSGENFVSPDGLQAIVAHLLENTPVECGAKRLHRHLFSGPVGNETRRERRALWRRAGDRRHPYALPSQPRIRHGLPDRPAYE